MINGFDKVIIPINIALSDRVEVNNFNITSIESGTSGHSVGHNGDLEKYTNKLNVLTQTLDNLLNS